MPDCCTSAGATDSTSPAVTDTFAADCIRATNAHTDSYDEVDSDAGMSRCPPLGSSMARIGTGW